MSTQRDTGRDRIVLIALLVAIVLLAFGLRLHGLDSSSLWLDELYTVTAAQQDLSSILRFHLTQAANPLLTSVITHLFFACCGQSEFVARLPSALFGTLSILLVYKVGQSLSSRNVALAGAFLMAVNAFHVQHSGAARYYALMVFLALLSLIFLIRALKGDSWRPWIGFALCTTLGLYNHYFALLLLPAEVLFAAAVIAGRWFEKRGSTDQSTAVQPSDKTRSTAKRALGLAVSLSAVGISYLPWMSTLRAQFPRQLHSTALGITLADLELAARSLHRVLIAHTGATGPLLAFWIVLLLWGLWTSGRRQGLLAAVWLLTPFLFLAVVDPRHRVQERYVIYILPLMLLVASKGLLSLTDLFSRALNSVMTKGKLHTTGAQVIAVLLVAALSAAPFKEYPTWQKGDWRSVVTYLLQSMGTNDIIIADGYGYQPGADADAPLRGLRYYFSLAGQSRAMYEPEGGLARRLNDVTDPNASAWGVLWHHVYNLRDPEQRDIDFEVIEFPKAALVRPLAPHGNLLADTRSILDAFVLLQPLPGGRIGLHLALAEIYARDGDQSEAQRQMQLAADAVRDAHQNQANVQLLLGDTYLQIGDFQEAVSAYEQALLMEADHTEARSRLQLLNQVLHEEIPHASWWNLGFRLALLGHYLDSRTVSPGSTIDVTLWWLAVASMNRDYTAFVHLTDEEGRLWAQDDRLLEDNENFSSTWAPATMVKQEFQVDLTPDLPPGKYTLWAGVYYWKTGERLIAWGGDDTRNAVDTIPLETIVVTK